MPAPPSRSKPALPAPDLAGGAPPPRSESQKRRVPRVTPQAPPAPVSPEARPPQPSEFEVDVELEDPAPSVREMAAPPARPAPRPGNGPAVGRPGVAAPLPGLSYPPPPPPGAGERPSKPSAPSVPGAGERPSKPSAPSVPGAGERPSKPLAASAEPASWPSPASGEGARVHVSVPAPAPVLDEPGPGSVLADRYQLVHVIGRGGMGAVWLARDVKLDIDVAIKLIRRDRAAPEARGRLLQEARAAARIGHPSIVRVFDFGETAGGDPYIVMELLHGEPLSSVLARKQRLSPNVAVSTLLPVASALVAAHAKGIVHRDLKPDNILLVTNEAGAPVPKLLDFGIARLLDSDAERRFTLAGEVLGSPDYMSPEQARGEVDVGAPTDIWAFTVMFYEAISGRRPFHGQNYNALIMAIITHEPVPSTELAAGDAELWSILHRGLAKQAAERWPSMRDLGAALAAWAMERGVSEDVAGTSLGSHWLPGGRPRTLTLYPANSMRSTLPGASPAPPGGAPVVAVPPPPRMPALETVTRPPFVPNRRRWGVVLAALALVAIGLVAYLVTRPSSAPEGAAAAPTASAAAPAPTAAPDALGPASTAAPGPTAGGGRVGGPSPLPIYTSRGGGTPPRPSSKQSAPPAPKKIEF